MDASSIETLTQSLPKSFPFYHLGEISLAEQAPDPASLDLGQALEGRSALFFRLRGDLQAALVMLVESGRDLSMYSEAGNILASQLVTRLANEHEIDVVLSPPTLMTTPRIQDFQALQNVSSSLIRQVYQHVHGEDRVPLETLIFISSLKVRTGVLT